MSAGTDARIEEAPRAEERRTHIPLAIFYMVASGAVFNCANAASKWLIATYPIGEVLFGRTLVALLTVAAASSCRSPGLRSIAPAACARTRCARARRSARRRCC